MKKTILSVIITVALTLGATCSIYNNRIQKINTQHQAQIEYVTDSINNHYINKIDSIHQNYMYKIDSLDIMTAQIFNNEYEINRTVNQQVYNFLHLRLSFDKARKELCLPSTKE